jgi:hypothetical protein
MRKKIFTLLLASAFAASLMAVVTPGPTITVTKATTAPVLDGTEEPTVWGTVEAQTIDGVYNGETPSISDGGTSYWKALWDDKGIYILVHVYDDVYMPNYNPAKVGASWEQDKIELYFDMNYPLAIGLADGKGPNTAGSGHLQFAPDISNTIDVGGVVEINGPGSWAMKKSGAAECLYEFYALYENLKNADGVAVKTTQPIGFDIIVVDNDATARQRAVWSSTLTESYTNLDDAGALFLEGQTEPIKATGISVTSDVTEITTDRGTVQLNLVITPEDATYKTATWKITGGSGKALLSSNGLLTGIINGTVTVVATTTDGSALESEPIDITISNQCVTIQDASEILDGSFDGLAPGKGGTWGASGTDSIEVVKGRMVCYNAKLALNQWDVAIFQNLGTLLGDGAQYELSFYASGNSDSAVLVLDLEDPTASYLRFGYSDDNTALNTTSEWHVPLTHEFIKYTLNVRFDDTQDVLDKRTRKFQILLGKTTDSIFVDSVYLVRTDLVDQISYNCPTTSVNTVKANTINVYPNPVVNELTITGAPANANVIIYNQVGQVMTNQVLKGSSINVSSYPSGMYIVKVNNNQVTKFVK